MQVNPGQSPQQYKSHQKFFCIILSSIIFSSYPMAFVGKNPGIKKTYSETAQPGLFKKVLTACCCCLLLLSPQAVAQGYEVPHYWLSHKKAFNASIDRLKMDELIAGSAFLAGDREYLVDAAESGSVAGQYKLAQYYRFENVLHPNAVSEEAYKYWLQKAAVNGYQLARTDCLLFLGYDCIESHPLATAWYTQDAEAGDTLAQEHLAYRYLNHQDCDPTDFALAIKWLTTAEQHLTDNMNKEFGPEAACSHLSYESDYKHRAELQYSLANILYERASLLETSPLLNMRLPENKTRDEIIQGYRQQGNDWLEKAVRSGHKKAMAEIKKKDLWKFSE